MSERINFAKDYPKNSYNKNKLMGETICHHGKNEKKKKNIYIYIHFFHLRTRAQQLAIKKIKTY
jgi:hypothetical protein